MPGFAKVLAVCAVGALACAPAAAAKPNKPPEPIVTASATGSATGPGSVATATATCPGPTRPLGGGFAMPSSAAVIGIVFESVKVRHRQWRVSAQLLDPGSPSTLTLSTYVYCRKFAPRTSTAVATVPTTGVPQIGPSATASCPSGQQALAGGFATPPPLAGSVVANLILDSHRNGPAAWSTRVATGPAGPSTVTTEVYCAPLAATPVDQVATSDPNSSSLGLSSATAGCPSGSTATAGGFAQPLSQLSSFFFVSESQRVGDGWRASGLHSGLEPGVTLSSVAYCSGP